MICRECAWEADRQHLLKRQIDAANRDLKEYGRSQIGHAGCKGCDCRHFPPGTLQPVKETR